MKSGTSRFYKQSALAFGVVFLLAACVPSHADEPVKMTLETVRPCTAEIQTSETAYTVSIEMKSITAFDRGTNKELSLQKADRMADLALVEFLIPDERKTKSLQFSGKTTKKQDWNEEICTMVCVYPKDGVKIVSAPAKSESTSEDTDVNVSAVKRPPFQSLFTLKDDYLDTLKDVVNLCESELPAMITSLDDEDAFSIAIDECEEKLRIRLKALQKMVNHEIKLLSRDKSEILTAIEVARGHLLEALKTRADRLDVLEKFPQFKADPEFAEVILSQPFLMENGGVKIVETADAWFLLAVANAAVMDSPKGKKQSLALRKMNARKAAEIKAKAKLAGEKEGQKVESKETLIEEEVVRKENGQETGEALSVYSQEISVSVHAILKNVKCVASWEAEDGELVSAAVGCRKAK